MKLMFIILYYWIKIKIPPAILFPFGNIFLSSLAISSSSLTNLDPQRDFDESMLFACKIEAFIWLPTRISSKNLNHTRNIINNNFQLFPKILYSQNIILRKCDAITQ